MGASVLLRLDRFVAATKIILWRQLFSVVFFGGVSLLLLAQSLLKPLDHDENQFVASGWLIARAGLLPYRDFPYFHLPYLSLVYALPFLVTNYLLLTARLISAGAALLGMFVLYYVIPAAQS